jgi:hypothetical protein
MNTDTNKNENMTKKLELPAGGYAIPLMIESVIEILLPSMTNLLKEFGSCTLNFGYSIPMEIWDLIVSYIEPPEKAINIFMVNHSCWKLYSMFSWGHHFPKGFMSIGPLEFLHNELIDPIWMGLNCHLRPMLQVILTHSTVKKYPITPRGLTVSRSNTRIHKDFDFSQLLLVVITDYVDIDAKNSVDSSDSNFFNLTLEDIINRISEQVKVILWYDKNFNPDLFNNINGMPNLELFMHRSYGISITRTSSWTSLREGQQWNSFPFQKLLVVFRFPISNQPLEFYEILKTWSEEHPEIDFMSL